MGSYAYLMGLKEILILEHISNSSRDRHLLPGLESLRSVLNGGVKLRLGGLGHFTDQLLSSL